MPGVAESEDAFGNSLAAGNFDGRHQADLAIGAPSEKVHTGYRAGAVTVLYSSAARLSTAGVQAWDRPAIPRESCLEVYRGQAAGLDQQNRQRFTLTDLGLPDDPRGQLTLQPSAAGSP